MMSLTPHGPRLDRLDRLDREGYDVVPDVVSPETVAALIASLDMADGGTDGGAGPIDEGGGAGGSPAVRGRGDRPYAMRNLLAVPAVRELAESADLRRLVEPVLGREARAVRGILFDKRPGANWKVAWHQDLSIAVSRRVEAAGFGPWSVKAGVVHVQPPVAVLRAMLTVRLSLDDCGPDNGPLRVLPGSHAGGVLSPGRVQAWRQGATAVPCLVGAGGVVLMRPLLLHASSSARSPGRRRIVHLEYAAGELPGGLQWYPYVAAAPLSEAPGTPSTDFIRSSATWNFNSFS